MVAISDEVVRRYAFKHDISVLESSELFHELELFLDMAAIHSTSPSERIDSAWHEFILHTKIYESFCSERYGRFVHHVPCSPLAGRDDANQRDVGCTNCSSGQPDGVAECNSTCASDCRSDQEYEVA